MQILSSTLNALPRLIPTNKFNNLLSNIKSIKSQSTKDKNLLNGLFDRLKKAFNSSVEKIKIQMYTLNTKEEIRSPSKSLLDDQTPKLSKKKEETIPELTEDEENGGYIAADQDIIPDKTNEIVDIYTTVNKLKNDNTTKFLFEYKGGIEIKKPISNSPLLLTDEDDNGVAPPLPEKIYQRSEGFSEFTEDEENGVSSYIEADQDIQDIIPEFTEDEENGGYIAADQDKMAEAINIDKKEDSHYSEANINNNIQINEDDSHYSEANTNDRIQINEDDSHYSEANIINYNGAWSKKEDNSNVVDKTNEIEDIYTTVNKLKNDNTTKFLFEYKDGIEIKKPISNSPLLLTDEDDNGVAPPLPEKKISTFWRVLDPNFNMSLELTLDI